MKAQKQTNHKLGILMVFCLNLGEAEHNSDNKFAWILAQRRIGQITNEIRKYNSVTHECNVISNILNTTTHAKSNIDHYSPILKGCMNTCSGREKFRNFWILLDSGSSSTIMMGNLTSKLKQNNHQKQLRVKTNQGSSWPQGTPTYIHDFHNLVRLKLCHESVT